MAERRYAVRAFSERDHALLKSIMALLGVRTQHAWSETEAVGDAHVVFVDMDAPGGGAAWESLKDRARVWCSRRQAAKADYVLELPAKLGTLEPLVETLERQLPEDAGGAPAETASDKPEATDDFPHIRGL